MLIQIYFMAKKHEWESWISWSISFCALPSLPLCCLEDRCERWSSGKHLEKDKWSFSHWTEIQKESEFLKASWSTISALDCPSSNFSLNRKFFFLLNLFKLLFFESLLLELNSDYNWFRIWYLKVQAVSYRI